MSCTSITYAGTLAPAAGPSSAVGTSFNQLSKFLTGINIATYSTRFLFLEPELSTVIEKTALSEIPDTIPGLLISDKQNYIFEDYSEVNESLMSLLLGLEEAINLGILYEIALIYQEIMNFKEEEWEARHRSFMANLCSFSRDSSRFYIAGLL